jgi:hypothetical protein
MRNTSEITKCSFSLVLSSLFFIIMFAFYSLQISLDKTQKQRQIEQQKVKFQDLT